MIHKIGSSYSIYLTENSTRSGMQKPGFKSQWSKTEFNRNSCKYRSKQGVRSRNRILKFHIPVLVHKIDSSYSIYLGEQEGGAAAGAAVPEEGSGGPAAEDTSEEAMLQRALAMSMDGGAPDLAAMTEEEQIAYAMRMSMADSQADAAQVGTVKISVADPEPDPYVLGPPGSGSLVRGTDPEPSIIKQK
jgi:hypothetical protein